MKRSRNTNSLRRERTTVRRWEGFVSASYVEVSAIRCTVCNGTWADDCEPAHRPGCLDAEINGGNS